MPHSLFSPRAHRCTFIGYPHGQKAYKLYDFDTHCTFTSPYVIFHKNSFPLSSIPHPPAASSLGQNPEPPLPITYSLDVHPYFPQAPTMSLPPLNHRPILPCLLSLKHFPLCLFTHRPIKNMPCYHGPDFSALVLSIHFHLFFYLFDYD